MGTADVLKPHSLDVRVHCVQKRVCVGFGDAVQGSPVLDDYIGAKVKILIVILPEMVRVCAKRDELGSFWVLRHRCTRTPRTFMTVSVTVRLGTRVRPARCLPELCMNAPHFWTKGQSALQLYHKVTIALTQALHIGEFDLRARRCSLK